MKKLLLILCIATVSTAALAQETTQKQPEPRAVLTDPPKRIMSTDEILEAGKLKIVPEGSPLSISGYQMIYQVDNNPISLAATTADFTEEMKKVIGQLKSGEYLYFQNITAIGADNGNLNYITIKIK